MPGIMWSWGYLVYSYASVRANKHLNTEHSDTLKYFHDTFSKIHCIFGCLMRNVRRNLSLVKYAVLVYVFGYGVYFYVAVYRAAGKN